MNDRRTRRRSLRSILDYVSRDELYEACSPPSDSSGGKQREREQQQQQREEEEQATITSLTSSNNDADNESSSSSASSSSCQGRQQRRCRRGHSRSGVEVIAGAAAASSDSSSEDNNNDECDDEERRRQLREGEDEREERPQQKQQRLQEHEEETATTTTAATTATTRTTGSSISCSVAASSRTNAAVDVPAVAAATSAASATATAATPSAATSAAAAAAAAMDLSAMDWYIPNAAASGARQQDCKCGCSPEQTVAREVERLSVLRSFHLVGPGNVYQPPATPPHAAASGCGGNATAAAASSSSSNIYETYCNMAKRLFRTDLSFVTLMDLGRVFFLAAAGVEDIMKDSGSDDDLPPMARRESICAHAILGADPVLVVPDARADARFADYPVVSQGLVRFCASAKLVSPEGFALGTICVAHKDPRPEGLTSNEVEHLQDLAALVMDTMVRHRALHRQQQRRQQQQPQQQQQQQQPRKQEGSRRQQPQDRQQPRPQPHSEQERQQQQQIIQHSSRQVLACAAHDLMTPLTGIQLSLSILNGSSECKQHLSEHLQECLHTAFHCSKILQTEIWNILQQKQQQQDDNNDTAGSDDHNNRNHLPSEQSQQQQDDQRAQQEQQRRQLPVLAAAPAMQSGPEPAASEKLQRPQVGGSTSGSAVAAPTGPSVRSLWTRTASSSTAVATSSTATSRRPNLALLTASAGTKEPAAESSCAKLARQRRTTTSPVSAAAAAAVAPALSSEKKTRLFPLRSPSSSSLLVRSSSGGSHRRSNSSAPALNHQQEKKTTKRALVIDDSVVVRKTLARALHSLDYGEVRTAANGLAGLQQLQAATTPFDLVLVDFLMPVMDGLDCIRAFRQWERTHKRPGSKLQDGGRQQVVIGMSAHASPADVQRGLSMGMNAFRPKPLRLQELKELQTTAHLLSMRQTVDNIDAAVIQQCHQNNNKGQPQQQHPKNGGPEGGQGGGGGHDKNPADEGKGDHDDDDDDVLDGCEDLDRVDLGKKRRPQPQSNGFVKTKKRCTGTSKQQQQQQQHQHQHHNLRDDIHPDERVCLIAASDVKCVEHVQAIAQSQGWSAASVSNAKDALQLLKTRNWGAVFVDCELPTLAASASASTNGHVPAGAAAAAAMGHHVSCCRSALACITQFREWEQVNRVHRQKNLCLMLGSDPTTMTATISPTNGLEETPDKSGALAAAAGLSLSAAAKAAGRRSSVLNLPWGVDRTMGKPASCEDVKRVLLSSGNKVATFDAHDIVTR